MAKHHGLALIGCLILALIPAACSSESSSSEQNISRSTATDGGTTRSSKPSATYKAVTADFERWDAIVHGYLDGNRSTDEIRLASRRAFKSANSALASSGPTGECRAALRQYTSAIRNYASSVGGADAATRSPEGYAKAAQGGQAVIDDCTSTWATSARPSEERVSVYQTEYAVCQGLTIDLIKRGFGFNQAGMSPKDVVMKMERTSYRAEFVQYAFQGCWDAIHKKASRYP